MDKEGWSREPRATEIPRLGSLSGDQHQALTKASLLFPVQGPFTMSAGHEDFRHAASQDRCYLSITHFPTGKVFCNNIAPVPELSVGPKGDT